MFRPNPNFTKELQGQRGTQAALERAAEAARPRVEQAQRDYVPNKDAAGAVVVEVEDGDVRLRNTDHGALVEEIGTAHTPPIAPLRRGVRAAGFRLDESERG